MLKSFASKLAGEAIIIEVIEWNNTSTLSNICRNVWESYPAALFRYWPTSFSLLISSVTASCCACSVVMSMFLFFNVARPGQLSSTHVKYRTSFLCCIWQLKPLGPDLRPNRNDDRKVDWTDYVQCPLCSYLHPVLHGNWLTFAITCTV